MVKLAHYTSFTDIINVFLKNVLSIKKLFKFTNLVVLTADEYWQRNIDIFCNKTETHIDDCK